jgi:hypothetical protein
MIHDHQRTPQPSVGFAGSDLGLWSAAGGVASAAYKYQLNVCDTAWMWTGLMMTGYTSSCF